jgi:2-polyprenyl-6-methoxyphenol hydroxylase-like FAD-dependent oxidoreductase
MVVGADGKHSFVARQVGAAEYRVRPARTFGAYTYWSGLPLPTGGEIHVRPGLTVPAFATNDGLTMVAMFGPLGEFDRFRRDPETAYLSALDRCGDLGQRARAGKREERLRATPDATNAFRVPYGPGWALVGDAGLVEDPVGAQGISNAFRDAELLADALVNRRDLADYHRSRDGQRRPMYDVVGDLANLRVGIRTRLLLRALRDRPDQADRFLGVLAGSVPPRPFLDPANVLRLLAGR